MVNEPRLELAEKLLLELLAIPGSSGRESQVMEYLRSRLAGWGLSPQCMEHDDAHLRSRHGGEIGNLIIRLPGTVRGARRLLSAHVDTVPLCQGARPAVRGRWIRSADRSAALGADNRAGTAILLFCLAEILERQLPHPPLTFLFTVQEELGLHGARHVALKKLGRPKLGFNFDGSSPEQVTIGATGGYRMEIIVRGIASHAGAAPADGASAIVMAALAISRLHERGWHGQIEKGRHSGTSNIGIFRGGDATNVVAPRVEIRAEARSHNPNFRMRIVREIRSAFQTAAREICTRDQRSGKIAFRGWLDYESFLLDRRQPVVQMAEQAVLRCGGQPEIGISNGGLDANWLVSHGIPTVTLGCGQRRAHTPEERLSLRQFRLGCRIALDLATDGRA